MWWLYVSNSGKTENLKIWPWRSIAPLPPTPPPHPAPTFAQPHPAPTQIERYFTSLLKMWCSWLEPVMSYGADKLNDGVNLDFWPWGSMSIAPQNNWGLDQCILHMWSKFGDPNLKGSRVIARTSSGLTNTRTDRPRDQSWPRVDNTLSFGMLMTALSKG